MTFTHKIKYLTALVVISACLCAIVLSCATKSTEKQSITVSIQPQKYMLEKITGDKWDIKCLLSNGANPEFYDPSLSHLINLENCKAYFRIGNIGFESAILNKVRNSNPDLKIYDNSEGIALISGTHGHAHETDPHTWTSVRNAKMIANNMFKAVVELDPSNKEYYSRHFKSFLTELDSLDANISTMLEPLRGQAFLVWHPSLSYFARDYGLEQISLDTENKESSILRLQNGIDHARSLNARVFFFQKDMDSRQAQAVNQQIGAEIVNINPLSYDWKEQILIIADAIASAHPN